jgi:hypothetical protein
LYFQLRAKNNLLFSMDIESPRHRYISYPLNAISYKRENIEYQQGNKVKRVFLPKFSSCCFTILRCLQKLQPIKITKFDSELSTFFPFLGPIVGLNG